MTASLSMIEAHLGMSQVLRSQGEWAAAITCCERAIQIDPNSVLAYSNLGAALSEHGRRDEAIRYLERAIQINPDFALAHGNLAVALQALGRLAGSGPADSIATRGCRQ